MLGEVKIDNVNFTLEAFIDCLIERLRMDGRAIPDEGLKVEGNQFMMVIRSPISTLLVNGILETHRGVHRLRLYISPDLETVKAVSKLINIGTKALELSGVIAAGSAGMLILAGKLGVEKIMERRKKEREIRRIRQIVSAICETDLMLEEHLIEPYELGLPVVTEKSWVHWETTYRALVDTYELRMEKELPRFFGVPVKLFRDRPFKDGTVDIFASLHEKDVLKGIVFLVTNRKPSMRSFRADEIMRIVRQAMHYESVRDTKDSLVICIFISASKPAYDPQAWKFLLEAPFVPRVESPFPLIIMLPPERGIWHNVMVPSRDKTFGSALKEMLQSLRILKKDDAVNKDLLAHSADYQATSQEIIGFLTRILKPSQIPSLL
ncbi:MAG: hypothetical protein ACE5I5_02435 [Candidatus Heimdallarchaeota archaeon]